MSYRNQMLKDLGKGQFGKKAYVDLSRKKHSDDKISNARKHSTYRQPVYPNITDQINNNITEMKNRFTNNNPEPKKSVFNRFPNNNNKIHRNNAQKETVKNDLTKTKSEIPVAEIDDIFESPTKVEQSEELLEKLNEETICKIKSEEDDVNVDQVAGKTDIESNTEKILILEHKLEELTDYLVNMQVEMENMIECQKNMVDAINKLSTGLNKN